MRAPITSLGLSLLVALLWMQPTPACAEAPQQRPADEASAGLRVDAVADARLRAAHDALLDGDVTEAIGLCSSVLAEGESEVAPRARELLGLAYERMGNFEDAESVYRHYLELYPDTAGARRVAQRLASLKTRTRGPTGRLRSTDAAAERPRWQVSGSLAQFYRRRNLDSDVPQDGTVRSVADSNLNVTMRRNDRGRRMRVHLDGRHAYDFIDSGDRDVDVDDLYFDMEDDELGIDGRIGRQIKARDGVLGRFDGIAARFQAKDWLELGINAGLPVDAAYRDRVETDRGFVGASVDMVSPADRWTLNLFLIEQWTGDATDRRAVGGELRYVDRNKTLLLLTDYDVYHTELNTIFGYAVAYLADGTSASVTASRRRTPTLTTSNALIGQAATSIDGLQRMFTNSEIERLADDRTPIEKLLYVIVQRPLDDRFELAADFALSDISDTDASGGVEAYEGTGTEQSYGLQLIATGVLGDSDVSTLGARLLDSDENDMVSLDLNTRLRLAPRFMLNPKLGVDYRFGDSAADSPVGVRPALRAEIFAGASHRLELELGAEWNRQYDAQDDGEGFEYSVAAGYRFAF